MCNTSMSKLKSKMPGYDEMMQASHELSQSSIDYDIMFPRMDIPRQDVFKYHVISALWDIAHSM